MSYNLGIPVNQIVDRISQVSASAVTSGVIYVDRENETLHRSDAVSWTEIGNLSDLTKGEFLWKLYNLTGTEPATLEEDGVAFVSGGALTSDTSLISLSSLGKMRINNALPNLANEGFIGFDTEMDETGIGHILGGPLKLISGGATQAQVYSSWMELFNLRVTQAPAAGSASGPPIAFYPDLDTGIYQRIANSLSFSASGVRRFEINDAYVESTVALHLPDGDLDEYIPSLTFASDTTSGWSYLDAVEVGQNVIRQVCGGELISTSIGIPGSGGTFIVSPGTAGLPGMSLGATDAGLYLDYSSYNEATETYIDAGIALSISGENRGIMGYNDFTLEVPILLPAGSATSPTLSFSDSPTTGLWLRTDGAEGLVVEKSGSSVAKFVDGGLVLPLGTAENPTLSFSPSPGGQVGTGVKGISCPDNSSIVVSDFTGAAARFGADVIYLYRDTTISGVLRQDKEPNINLVAANTEVAMVYGNYVKISSGGASRSMKSLTQGNFHTSGTIITIQADGQTGAQNWTLIHNGAASAGYYPFILDGAASHTITSGSRYMYQFVLDLDYGTGAWLQVSPRTTIV